MTTFSSCVKFVTFSLFYRYYHHVATFSVDTKTTTVQNCDGYIQFCVCSCSQMCCYHLFTNMTWPSLREGTRTSGWGWGWAVRAQQRAERRRWAVKDPPNGDSSRDISAQPGVLAGVAAGCLRAPVQVSVSSSVQPWHIFDEHRAHVFYFITGSNYHQTSAYSIVC